MNCSKGQQRLALGTRKALDVAHQRAQVGATIDLGDEALCRDDVLLHRDIALYEHVVRDLAAIGELDGVGCVVDVLDLPQLELDALPKLGTASSPESFGSVMRKSGPLPIGSRRALPPAASTMRLRILRSLLGGS